MKKSPLVKSILFIYSLSFISLLQAASVAKNDPLQIYRDEVKQAEANALQAVREQLKSSTDYDNAGRHSYTKPSTDSQSAPAPSSKDRAFIPSTTETTKNNPPTSTNTTNNPWLKPNPWENVAKENPWANAPIPGPSSPTNSKIPSPPNIFAPPQQRTAKLPDTGS